MEYICGLSTETKEYVPRDNKTDRKLKIMSTMPVNLRLKAHTPQFMLILMQEVKQRIYKWWNTNLSMLVIPVYCVVVEIMN